MSAIYLIAVPLLAAFISILVKKVSPYLLLLVSAASVVAMYFVDLETIVIGGFTAPYGISLVVDRFSQAGLFAVNVLFFLVVALNINNYKKMSSILLVALAGLNGLLLTGDLFNLFVFLEVSGIAAYLITTTNKKPLATFNYLVAGTVGSSLYLLGLILLYAMFGTLNMADMSQSIADSGVSAAVVSLPFLLMFIGFGVEAKLLPFNSWVKGILGHSNSLSGPMIASVYATAMGLVFGRLLSEVFVFDDKVTLIIAVVVVLSVVAGEAMAYASTKVREILLFSSIAQAALVVLLFVNGFVGWAIMLAIANGVTKFLLFSVINKATEVVGSDEISSLKGLFVNNKIIGVSFTAASLSIIGLPLFVGFIIKMKMLESLFTSTLVLPFGNYFYPAVILLSSIVEGVYFIKLLVSLWYDKENAPVVHYDVLLKYVGVVIALGLIVYGVFQGNVVDFADSLGAIILQGGVF